MQRVALGYDARGNLTTSGSTSYAYTGRNLMFTAGGNSFFYDALGRLDIDYKANQNLLYAGSQLLSVRNASSGATTERYVYGLGEAPIVSYDANNTRRWLYTDERGTVIALADDAGNAQNINGYDEFGIPAGANTGRFQYTGQQWLPAAGLYYYKARMYSPTLGRFMQTDPIGYADGINWYNYVGGDPVNATDPSGLACGHGGESPTGEPGDIVVVGVCPNGYNLRMFSNDPGGASGPKPSEGGSGPEVPDDIIVRANPCPNSGGILGWLPHGGGITGGLAGSAGLPKVAGAAVQGSLGVGGFVDNNGNATRAGFNSAGAAAYAGGSSVGSPSQSSPSVLGGSITGGFSGFLTNAQSERQLSGPFTTRTLDVGVGWYQASISLSTGGGIWQLSFSPPGAGLTLGASYSNITTTTTDSGIGCY